MKRFIHKSLSFASILVIPLIIGVLIGNLILNRPGYWKLPEETKYIVLGNSHPECAFNDSLIINTLNFSQSGESYFYTFLKARKIITTNENIKAIFIEFGNINVSKDMDSWTWDDVHIQNFFPRFFPLFDFRNFKFLMGKNSNAILSCPPKSYIEEIGFTYYSSLLVRKGILSTPRRFGGYKYLVRDKIDSLNNISLLETEFDEICDNEISQTNIDYLQKIIDVCNQNNTEVFLIRSPLHSKYNANNEQTFNKVLEANFSNQEFLDLSSFTLQNENYADFDHLNHKGARIFSIWFDDLLKKGLLEKGNKQTFIDEQIKLRTSSNIAY